MIRAVATAAVSIVALAALGLAAAFCWTAVSSLITVTTFLAVVFSGGAAL